MLESFVMVLFFEIVLLLWIKMQSKQHYFKKGTTFTIQTHL